MLVSRMSLYLVAFVICWVPDVAHHILGLVGACPPFWLSLAQDFFVPLQGFVNFLVFTYADPEMRRLLLACGQVPLAVEAVGENDPLMARASVSTPSAFGPSKLSEEVRYQYDYESETSDGRFA